MPTDQPMNSFESEARLHHLTYLTGQPEPIYYLDPVYGPHVQLPYRGTRFFNSNTERTLQGGSYQPLAQSEWVYFSPMRLDVYEDYYNCTGPRRSGFSNFDTCECAHCRERRARLDPDLICDIGL